MTTLRARSLIVSLVSFIALAAVLLIAFPQFSHASTGLKIQPVKIIETLTPGQTVTGAITLTNESDSDVDLQTSLQDFVPVSGADSIQFVGRAPGVTSVRDWITISGSGSSSPILFKKGETSEIPYTITAPSDAEPGGHFGVILFKATEPNNTSQLKVGTQVGVLVLINIPGNHLEKGNILSFTAPPFIDQNPIPFSMKFQNTGTVYYEPTGQITISNMFGQKVGSVPIGGEIVLPTSIKTLTYAVNASGILVGPYSAVATIVDGDGNVITTSKATFWAFPIWYSVAFIVVLALLFFLIRFLKSKVKISFR